MIPGVFPRLYGSFREGAIAHAKFAFTTVGATPVIAIRPPNSAFAAATLITQPAATARKNGQVYLEKTTPGAANGTYTITLQGGARNLAAVRIAYINKAGAVAGCLHAEIVSQNDQTGSIVFQFITPAGAFADAVTINDEVHVTLYADK